VCVHKCTEIAQTLHKKWHLHAKCTGPAHWIKDYFCPVWAFIHVEGKITIFRKNWNVCCCALEEGGEGMSTGCYQSSLLLFTYQSWYAVSFCLQKTMQIQRLEDWDCCHSGEGGSLHHLLLRYLLVLGSGVGWGNFGCCTILVAALCASLFLRNFESKKFTCSWMRHTVCQMQVSR
jgi:hypothetical protein